MAIWMCFLCYLGGNCSLTLTLRSVEGSWHFSVLSLLEACYFLRGKQFPGQEQGEILLSRLSAR